MWKYIIAWIPLVFIAILNGLFRERFLANNFKELYAHQISTITFIILSGIYIWILISSLKPESLHQALIIGLIWLCCTIIFEFLFGHYVAGHSWNKLFNDYNIFKGRLWILILFWTAIAPYIFYKIQH